jgi:uncharacterized protein
MDVSFFSMILQESGLTTHDLWWIIFAFVAGGFVKGVIGLGMPFVAIPVISFVADVPTAVGLVAFPSIFPNIVQLWMYRAHASRPGTAALMSVGTILGTGVGVSLLVQIDKAVIAQLLGVLLLAYLVLRIVRIDLALSPRRGAQIALPTGILSGVLGGMTGLSAPVTLTYFMALKLSKYEFIFAVSVFFIAIGSAQAFFYVQSGFISHALFVMSALALIPILIGMRIGTWITQYISQVVFERSILGLMALLGLKLTLGL